jgi:hypothetical protein
MPRQQKITREMRSGNGPRRLLVYCGDYKCAFNPSTGFQSVYPVIMLAYCHIANATLAPPSSQDTIASFISAFFINPSTSSDQDQVGHQIR